MQFELLDIQPKDGYHICTLNNGKGNALNPQLIKELSFYFTDFAPRHSQGVILTGKGNIFSVGLDMKAMLQMEENDFAAFFNAFMDLVLDMVRFPLPLIAAINGHSPAGGCLLSLCADYRIMVNNDQVRIGLNELPVGIMVPPSIFKLYAFWLGNHNAYQFLLTGKQASPSEAFDAHLVDQLADHIALLEKAELKMREYLSFDQTTWKGIKQNLRSQLVREMLDDKNFPHLDPVTHFVKNNGKAILLKKLAELKGN